MCLKSACAAFTMLFVRLTFGRGDKCCIKHQRVTLPRATISHLCHVWLPLKLDTMVEYIIATGTINNCIQNKNTFMFITSYQRLSQKNNCFYSNLIIKLEIQPWARVNTSFNLALFLINQVCITGLLHFSHELNLN